MTIPQGATMLYRRIRFAADEVCSPLDHGDLSSKAHKNRHARARATALLRIQLEAQCTAARLADVQHHREPLMPCFLIGVQKVEITLDPDPARLIAWPGCE